MQGQTLTGEVDHLLAPASFTIQERVGTREMLVINATGEPVTIAEDSRVRVTGNVEVFDLVEAESMTGQDFDEVKFHEFADQPVLMATSITVIERD